MTGDRLVEYDADAIADARGVLDQLKAENDRGGADRDHLVRLACRAEWALGDLLRIIDRKASQ